MLASTLLILATLFIGSSEALSEPERMEKYHERGYEWPLPEVVPNTPGWRKLMDRRFEQMTETMSGSNHRYNAWLSVIASALVQPNYTENGWGLTRAPEYLVEELKQKLYDNLDTAPLETKVNVIESDTEAAQPLFIENRELNDKILRDLKPMHEEWSGLDLEGEIAYGLRVYRNNSRLLMHVDKSVTHIISCILHIDHSEDSEPWPIVIEDFQGNTNEVILESGDMLFYESSKCLHGRPHKFKGSWYSSIFVHYYPVGWDTQNRKLEMDYAVPPHWRGEPEWETNFNKLEMRGTSMKEPDCPNVWCASINTVKWQGPAIEGKVITAGWPNPNKEELKRDENGLPINENDDLSYGELIPSIDLTDVILDDDYYDDEEEVAPGHEEL